jgi:hypothetical protein
MEGHMEQRLQQASQAVTSLGKNSRMLSTTEICSALSVTLDDCVALMDLLVERGQLRKTISRSGGIFYWISSPALKAND